MQTKHNSTLMRSLLLKLLINRDCVRLPPCYPEFVTQDFLTLNKDIHLRFFIATFTVNMPL